LKALFGSLLILFNLESLLFQISNYQQNWGAHVWRDGGTSPGSFWRDDDVCGLAVCSLPHCLCK